MVENDAELSQKLNNEISNIREKQRSGCHLGFFENFILHNIAANITEISRKHVFAASNTNIIKNGV